MTTEDPNVQHLADMIADTIVDNSIARDGNEEADHDGPGRVLATVDGREYLITIAANTEQTLTLPVPPSERIRQLEDQLSLAREFRVPCTNKTGGYAEVAVEPGRDDSGLWAVTDGSFTGKRAWLGDGWVTIYETGWTAVALHARAEAIALARRVADIEGAAIDAWVAKLIAAGPTPSA